MKSMWIFLVSASFMMVTPSLKANNKVEEIVEKEGEKQSKNRKKRRKKVQMCQECGKPETQCKCDGHGVEADHDDKEKPKK